jgi:hypothetical protein
MNRDEQSLRELVRQLGTDASLLVRQEAELARREIEDKIATAARQTIALAAGAAVLYAGFLAVTAGVIVAIGSFVALWVAALAVGSALVVAGGALLLIGRYGLRDLDPVPRDTVSNVRADFQALQHAAR